MQTETIARSGNIFALIIRNKRIIKRVEFYTSDQNSLQVGKHFQLKNSCIRPHKHVPVKVKSFSNLQEVLYIEEGRMRVIFYDLHDKKVQSKILKTGDLILLMGGGHGFEFIKDTRMIEIKQGPYNPKSKKELKIGNSL